VFSFSSSSSFFFVDRSRIKTSISSSSSLRSLLFLTLMDRSGSCAPSAAGGPSSSASRQAELPASPHTGTTIVAVAFDGGVVIGADSRVSTGTYVSNRAADKLHPLSDNTWLLRSGSAADTQAIGDYGESGEKRAAWVVES